LQRVTCLDNLLIPAAVLSFDSQDVDNTPRTEEKSSGQGDDQHYAEPRSEAFEFVLDRRFRCGKLPGVDLFHPRADFDDRRAEWQYLIAIE